MPFELIKDIAYPIGVLVVGHLPRLVGLAVVLGDFAVSIQEVTLSLGFLFRVFVAFSVRFLCPRSFACRNGIICLPTHYNCLNCNASITL